MAPAMVAARVSAAFAKSSTQAGSLRVREVSSTVVRTAVAVPLGVKFAVAAYAGLGCATVGLSMKEVPQRQNNFDRDGQVKGARTLSRATRAIE